MVKFVKFEMIDVTGAEVPIAVNPDHIISVKPHEQQAEQCALVMTREVGGGPRRWYIVKGTMDQVLKKLPAR